MRYLFLSLALAFMLPVAGCAALQSTAQQVQPQTPREALAVASVTFLGAVNLANNMVQDGTLDRETATDLLATFQTIDRTLVLAQQALRVGDAVKAGEYVQAATLALHMVSADLVRRAQAAGRLPA